ncbi:hypothetical protein D3C72_1260440 [compost metagenome]
MRGSRFGERFAHRETQVVHLPARHGRASAQLARAPMGDSLGSSAVAAWPALREIQALPARSTPPTVVLGLSPSRQPALARHWARPNRTAQRLRDTTARTALQAERRLAAGFRATEKAEHHASLLHDPSSERSPYRPLLQYFFRHPTKV